MQTKYNIGDAVYVADVNSLRIYIGTICKITVNEEEILYQIEYTNCQEKRCHSTFEEARTYLVKCITGQYQKGLNTVLALKDAEKAN